MNSVAALQLGDLVYDALFSNHGGTAHSPQCLALQGLPGFQPHLVHPAIERQRQSLDAARPRFDPKRRKCFGERQGKARTSTVA